MVYIYDIIQLFIIHDIYRDIYFKRCNINHIQLLVSQLFSVTFFSHHQKLCMYIYIYRNPGGNCSGKCGQKARCVQRFHTKLLISINMDKERECPMMKLFRFPSACVCDSAKYH